MESCCGLTRIRAVVSDRCDHWHGDCPFISRWAKRWLVSSAARRLAQPAPTTFPKVGPLASFGRAVALPLTRTSMAGCSCRVKGPTFFYFPRLRRGDEPRGFFGLPAPPARVTWPTPAGRWTRRWPGVVSRDPCRQPTVAGCLAAKPGDFPRPARSATLDCVATGALLWGIPAGIAPDGRRRSSAVRASAGIGSASVASIGRAPHS